MRVELLDEPTAFLDAIAPFIRADPVRNISILTTLDRRVSGSPPSVLLAAYDDGGTVIGAALVTAGQGFLTDLPGVVVPAVTRKLAQVVPDIAWIQAERRPALLFARRWKDALGKEFEAVVVKRLHRLGRLIPHEAPGAAGLAGHADQQLCMAWDRAVLIELGEPPVSDSRSAVPHEIGCGRIWLWRVAGRPVSMLGHKATVMGAIRVGPVYTPPDKRGNGYASALTSHACEVLRLRCREVCLFTDLANPTSNKIYAAIGFEPVTDFVKYAFS